MCKTPKTKAVILIGPTGSGKSPVGNFLEKTTSWTHLDFGHILRNIESDLNNLNFESEEVEYIKLLLSTNALFSPDKTSLALKIINNYLLGKTVIGLILNGFPRNLCQASEILKIYDVKAIINLKCKEDIVIQRIIKRANGEGFDHAKRKDDHFDAILNKIRIFNEETLPLLAFFERNKVKIIDFDINSDENEQILAKTIVSSLNLFKNNLA